MADDFLDSAGYMMCRILAPILLMDCFEGQVCELSHCRGDDDVYSYVGYLR